MLGAETGAALVAGGASAPSAPRAVIRVVRSFLWDGAIRQVGEDLSIDLRDARGLVHAGKAQILPPADPPADPPAEDAPAPAAKPAKEPKR